MYKYCLVGKATRKSFEGKIKVEILLQLIHSNICGLMNVRARHRAWCFIAFTNDYSRFGYVYLISHKS